MKGRRSYTCTHTDRAGGGEYVCASTHTYTLTCVYKFTYTTTYTYITRILMLIGWGEQYFCASASAAQKARVHVDPSDRSPRAEVCADALLHYLLTA